MLKENYMSDVVQDQEKAKYDSLKDLSAEDLSARKMGILKDLKKARASLMEFDLDKSSERAKCSKSMDKFKDQILTVVIIDKLLKDKDY